VFCLLVVLVKLSLLAKWLARKTPLRKPNRGEEFISIKTRPKRAYDCVGLLCSFVVLLHDICVLPRPHCSTVEFLFWQQSVFAVMKMHHTLMRSANLQDRHWRNQPMPTQLLALQPWPLTFGLKTVATVHRQGCGVSCTPNLAISASVLIEMLCRNLFGQMELCFCSTH